MKYYQKTGTTKAVYKVSSLLTAGHGIPISQYLGYGTDYTIVRTHSTQTSSRSWTFCES